MMNLSELNDVYAIFHLDDSDDLSLFTVSNKKGKGLENYLKYQALNDEKSGIARTYLVKTIDNKEIVAYFTLRTGLITISRGFLKGSDAMGSAKPSVRIEKYIYRHVKPAYDKSCRFMARTINN